MADRVDHKTLRTIAGLARLEPDDRALSALAEDVERVLTYLSRLESVDTEAEWIRPPTPRRADVTASTPAEAVLEAAPELVDRLFAAPAALPGDEA